MGMENQNPNSFARICSPSERFFQDGMKLISGTGLFHMIRYKALGFRCSGSGIQFLFLAFLLFACSNHKEGSEIEKLPIYQTEKFVVVPGEKLEYEASAGVFKMGNLVLEVLQSNELMLGKVCTHIKANAQTRSGISWLSEIRHDWDSWIDTSNGISVRMHRKVQENKYRAEQDMWFYPDSNFVVQQELHKQGQPKKTFPMEPNRMSDLVNTMWKLRYTPFDDRKTGDTLHYASFFDGEFIVLKVKYGGVKNLKWKGKVLPCYVLYPTGLQSRYLRGKDPSEIWIEKGDRRRPLKIKVSTYLGNLSVDLKS